MKVIYPLPELLPDPRARFIQILNTCNALAETGTEVILIAGIKRGYSKDDIFEFYGIPRHPKFKILKLPLLRREHARHLRFSWHGVFHLTLLLHLLLKKSYKDSGTALYLRHIKLSDFIMRFRRILNIPIAFEVHEIFHLSTVNEKRKAKLKVLETSVYKRAGAIVSISESLKEYLINMGIARKSIHVIHDGVKGDWLNIQKESQGSFICYAGSLYFWKGIDTLIAAMKYLPDEKLLIVGGDSRLDELKNLAESEGVADRVKFTGAVPHNLIPEYLSKAKIAVLPNVPEGPSRFSSPLKLFEYMSCGIPVVASDMPAFREILSDGKNALLFEPGNSKALAMSIRELAENPELAEKLASTAREDAKGYTYEERAKKIAGVLENLIPQA